MNRRSFCKGSVAAAVAASLAATQSSFAALKTLSVVPLKIPAVTGDREPINLERAAIAELADALRGNLLLPGSDGYDTARHVRNGSINKYPALIVQPTGVADIQQAVNFARERELLLAVKCGGHSWSGKSSCDGGMQIDLSTFRHVRVDSNRRLAYAAGGSLLGELDHEAMALGLVTTAGTVSHTGIGGLTLGGGFGRLARRFGLALDNVRAVDIVTADGQLRHASADNNPDLYWGVRGGGGNFGVVTEFQFDLHPMQRTVVGGDMVFPIAKARDVLRFYADHYDKASDNLYIDLIMMQPPGEADGVIIVHVCHSGTEAEAEQELKMFEKLGTPVHNSVQKMLYVDIQKNWDEADPRALASYMKSGFVSEIDDRLVDSIVDNFEPRPDRMTSLFFQVAGGAISRVPVENTAFPHRYASHAMFTITAWPTGADGGDRHIADARRYWSTLEPFTRGYYTNETSNESQQVINQNYQQNLDRLVAVKTRYDKSNLFRLNANVKPQA